MLMSDMMTRDVPLIHPEDNLRQGIELLRWTKLDALPVVDEAGFLIGIFTKANVLDAFLSGADTTEKIERHYNPQVVTVEADTPYREVEQRAKHSSVGTGVVVDKEGKALGIFTKVDMIMALFGEAEQLATKLNTVYQAMPNGIIVVDRNNRIQQINLSGEKILGLEQEALNGRLFSSIFPDLDLSLVLKQSRHLVGIQTQINQVTVLCNISPVSELAGAVIVFQALTDLDQVALELDATKRLYETLLTVTNIAYEAIFVVDDQGKITLINEAACQFFGKREKELLQQPVDQVIENTRLLRTLKTGMAETNEIQVIHGRAYIVSRLPIVRQGKIIGAVGKITFQKLEEVKDVAQRLAQMDHELSFYKEQWGSTRLPVTFSQIITISQDMRRLKQDAEMAARGNSTIMLTGESGTGKELFAEAIHQASLRRKGPYVKVNCAAVPENLLESEFFGYISGAFTGAQKGGKAGKFAVANGGTLFLDEIGDMSLNLQSKLLRVLEDKCFEPIGSNEVMKVDVRIIAATNQDLIRKVEKGEFRRDLYYRLNVINFHLIPLHARLEDVIPLVHVFLERLNHDFGKQIEGVSPDVHRTLIGHRWPGNVRELKNVIERAVNFASGGRLELEDLPFYLKEAKREEMVRFEKGWNLENAHEHLDKDTLEKALIKVNGNKSEAARLLGISRSWLYEKIRRYEIQL
ncbi:sigma-54-dependent Fis family transcriptional regulator [Desulfosporosinus sp. BICA1-9]|uniref:sigma-54-dependent Fis family transcriptional regulator n=1 Tax=Desulfosporosinus sp. BICA1-9 TaxID=1531958 RepID=UPI00054B1A16|nr:sigma-54-dependent Fis family transcriptional regulator [Desulfosporosinus sp. BICA1-9]KJS50039.1 MAG: diguanylate cyclase [Peptococcaceae bacterium BRH_c23]KJS86362.1 MAG: diguanylate cyclase [Desulfosporosinus sp. BICA1-9]HBW35613.1 CBS domain-containing protein [Desulfosporosinus sp.]